MSEKTVVIATPNQTDRAKLGQMIDRVAEHKVVAKTSDLMNTYNVVEEKLPTVVLISDTLANLPEFEVMRALFATLKTRWLVIATAPTSVQKGSSFSPSGAQGQDIVSVPQNASEEAFLEQIRALTQPITPLCSETKAAREIIVRAPRKAIRHEETIHDRPRKASIPSPVDATERMRVNTRSVQPIHTRRPSVLKGTAYPTSTAATRRAVGRLILIGASTGGVDALLNVLARFPVDCPPTLIVQHTGVGFGESLVGLLGRQCLPDVLLATSPQPLVSGQVLVAAGTQSHLVIDPRGGTRSDILAQAPVSGHVPSVDVLFKSAAPFASRVSAALLTGMGRDGAEGMKVLHDAGALTIAQNKASSVVYGMPRAAVEAHSVKKVLHIDQIAEALLISEADAALTSEESKR